MITWNFTFHAAVHVLGYIVSKHKFEQLHIYIWVFYLSHFCKYYWVIEDSKDIWKVLTAAFINNLSEHKTYRKDTTETVIFKTALKLLAHEFNGCEECELRFLLQLFHLHDCSGANPKTNGDKPVFIKESE